MREYLSPEREANSIRLQRSTFLGAFLLVEGRSDKIFYERFVDKLRCEVKSFAGKIAVIQILNILEKSNFNGVLAIVDADFDRLEGSPHNSPNLLRTDTHDLETMLIKSLALDRILVAFGSEEKISKFGRDIRQVLLESVSSVGYLLWVSQCENLGLTFNGIKFKNFVDKDTLQINELKMIQEVRNKSKVFSSRNEEIQQKLTTKKNTIHDLWQVCRGHDLVEILSIGLHKTLGSNNEKDVEPRSPERKNTLETNLQLAYQDIYLRDTQLYLNIVEWESNNHLKFLRVDI
jgi:Protein of unknown function (DUF4435)